MRNRVLNITLCLLAVILFSSCNKDEDYFNGDYMTNYVTYDGIVDGVVHFSYQAVEDSPIIKLSSTQSFKTDWEVGKRVVIFYTILNEKSSTDKIIEITNAIDIIYDPLRMTSIENIKASPNSPIRLKSIWRTGSYINLDCTVPFTQQGRQFQLVMDESTRHNEMVEAYLIQNLMGAETYFWRKAYASFFIGNAWNSPSCKIFRIHLIDESYPETYYDFKRK